jgi:photosystem II stability/assembly factor-like uncharacterized protein
MEVKRMYIGTDRGLRIMTGVDGHWQHYQDVLDGRFVRAMTTVRGENTAYACVIGEGLYATWDGGNTWKLALPKNVHAVAVDPTQSKVVYAGIEPVGLFRSTDGGATWNGLSGLQRVPEHVRDKWWFPRPPHEGHVLSIFIDWHNPRVLCVGLEHGGILRSVDGGENWEDLSDGIEYLDIHTVKGDPVHSNLYYTATARGFYRSDQYGHNWIFSQSGVNRSYFHDLVVIPADPPVLLLTTANGTPPAWMRKEKAQSAIFRSLDRGQSWHQLRGGLPESMERMVWNLSIDPENPDYLYICTGEAQDQRTDAAAARGSVLVSADRGNTWTQIYEGPDTIRSVSVGIQ